MKVKLLKKIKKDWSIKHYTDDVLIKEKTVNGPIFRALYKNKWVDFAWIEAQSTEDYRLLILAIAYNISFKVHETNWKQVLLITQSNRQEFKRRKRCTRVNSVLNSKTIWP